MTKSDRLILTVGLLLACGFLLMIAVLAPGLMRLMVGRFTPTPDVVGTFRSLVSTGSPAPLAETPPDLVLTPAFAATPLPGTAVPSPVSGGPGGHIVWTCQIYKDIGSEQICMMNSDGSNARRLTTEDGFRHYYAALSPDGKSVVYSAYREDNVYEIYELNINTGRATRLTDRLGVLNAPEVSPDGKSIVFMRWTVASDQYQVWVMDRGGSNPRRVFKGAGWDPTWSPDGRRILFASDRDGPIQLYVGNVDGSHIQRISNLPGIRGRGDWSSQNLITTYSGEAWTREVFIMNLDGSSAHKVSPKGGNSQGPSFSPAGQWIAFTAYYDHFNDINGCEIYIMRIDGSDLRRLTNNDYCDYQPRWGP
jgi:Tol biopolymer transport system component